MNYTAVTDYETSSEMGEMAKALVKAQKAMPAAVKDARNPHLKNKYADLASVREAVLPVFLANGIAVTQGAAVGQAGYVAVVTQFTHESGQWMRARVEVPYQEQKGTNIAQAYGSALSYARRYSLAAMACVIAEDDDGNGAAPPAREPAALSTDVEAAAIRDILAATSLDGLKAVAVRVGRNPTPAILDVYNARKAELS